MVEEGGVLVRKDLRWKFWVTIFLGFLCVIFVVLPYNNPNLKALLRTGSRPSGLDLQEDRGILTPITGWNGVYWPGS